MVHFIKQKIFPIFLLIIPFCVMGQIAKTEYLDSQYNPTKKKKHKEYIQTTTVFKDSVFIYTKSISGNNGKRIIKYAKATPNVKQFNYYNNKFKPILVQNIVNGVEVGTRFFYNCDNVLSLIDYKNGKQNGEIVKIHLPDSIIMLRYQAVLYKRVGVATKYYDNGVIESKTYLGKNRTDSVFYRNGKIMKIKVWKNDVLQYPVETFRKDGKDLLVYENDSSIIKAKFIGDKYALNKYISNNVEYPQGAIDNEIEGTPMVYFVINKDGSVCDVCIESSIYIGHQIEENAMKVISEMPNWSPATSGGRHVKMFFQIPIRFKLI